MPCWCWFWAHWTWFGSPKSTWDLVPLSFLLQVFQEFWSPRSWWFCGGPQKGFSWIRSASAKAATIWKRKLSSAWLGCWDDLIGCSFFGIRRGLRDCGASLSLLPSWKAKQDQDDKKKETLIIRPTLLGPICILLFFFFALLSLPLILAPHGDVRAMAICTSAVCSIAVGYLAVRATRGYFRSLQTMEQQLQSLSFDRAECHCCKQNHRYPSGRPMLCDKEVVKDCVNLWFGSQEAFEDFVRSKVSDIMIRKLNHVWGYRTALGVAAPVMWIFIDFTARYLVLEHKLLFLANMPFFRRLSFSYLMTGTCFWLMNVPSALQFASAVCKLGCRSGSTPCREIAKNLLVLSCIALWLSIIHVAPFILHNHSAFWLLHGKDVSLTAAIFPMLCSLIISRSRACMPIWSHMI